MRQRKPQLGDFRGDIWKEQGVSSQQHAAQKEQHQQLRKRRCFCVLFLILFAVGFPLFYHLRSLVPVSLILRGEVGIRSLALKVNVRDNSKLDGFFVTFIIPTTLSRKTLHRTLQSLVNQTDQTNWNAIVGIDMTTINHLRMRGMGSKEERIEAALEEFLAGIDHDDRFQFCKISTSSKFRGRKKNGSGLVRNEMIQKYANSSEWVAFLDDDDTLSPFYVQFLKNHVAKSEKSSTRLDIVVFRMQGFPLPNDLVPPMNHTSHTFNVGDIGISYAVRRKVFDSVLFVSHPSEDYLFVKKVTEHSSFEQPSTSTASNVSPMTEKGIAGQKRSSRSQRNERNFQVGISTCLAYYIRQDPPNLAEVPLCSLESNIGNPVVLNAIR